MQTIDTLDGVVDVDLSIMLSVKVYGRWNGVYPTTGCIERVYVDLLCRVLGGLAASI